MSTEEKKRLVDNLTEVHISTRAVLDGIDLDMPVHMDSGWRVRDIIGHLATWDQEIVNSLQAFTAGSEYLTPDLDEEEVDFNERAVLKQSTLSSQQILEAFEKANTAFCSAIQNIPDERFSEDFPYPWGNERGDISTLVGYMIEHAVEHRDEIERAVQEIQND